METVFYVIAIFLLIGASASIIHDRTAKSGFSVSGAGYDLKTQRHQNTPYVYSDVQFREKIEKNGYSRKTYVFEPKSNLPVAFKVTGIIKDVLGEAGYVLVYPGNTPKRVTVTFGSPLVGTSGYIRMDIMVMPYKST